MGVGVEAGTAEAAVSGVAAEWWVADVIFMEVSLDSIFSIA